MVNNSISYYWFKNPTYFYVKPTGQWFLAMKWGTYLPTDGMFAPLQSSGILPVSRELLIIVHNRAQICSLISLSSHHDIWSIPGASSGLRLLSFFKMTSGNTRISTNLSSREADKNCFGFGKLSITSAFNTKKTNLSRMSAATEPLITVLPSVCYSGPTLSFLSLTYFFYIFRRTWDPVLWQQQVSFKINLSSSNFLCGFPKCTTTANLFSVILGLSVLFPKWAFTSSSLICLFIHPFGSFSSSP